MLSHTSILESNSEELERWLANLLILLFLNKEGYRVLNYSYEFCGCGNCHNNYFLASCISIIFNSEVTYEELDYEEDLQFYQEVLGTEEPDFILGKFIIQDKNAKAQVVLDPLIQDRISNADGLFMINTIENESWEIITEEIYFEEYLLIELCILLKQLSNNEGGGACA